MNVWNAKGARYWRGRALQIVLLFLLISCAFCVPFLAQAQLPLEPFRDSGASITGAFEGWYKNSDGSYSLLVGYFNRNQKQTLDIPVGPENHIDPGGPDQGQPTHFLPRRQWGVFTITVPKDFGNKRLTWTITANGQTTSVPLHLDSLWIVTPFEDAGVGNTPPVVRFQPAGAAFTGPPHGVVQSFSVKAGEPLPLTVWVTDDGKQPPEARPRQGPPASILWSQFRGPGSVTFENARPTVAMDDGKASTTAKFSAPGEYIIRGQANDASGDGGGGFQCCWTNVHVKVTVTP
ncbi:MAG: hypothetical protein DMG14_20745 [Acidobacteria bacterium]|nr:MAG: hypothetical protein DMG14_20745 [Acidobacteriota bacterium]